jgi:thiol-disulfide isomerase/thioredoxin
MKVLKFGASWCQGCKTMVPRWEEIEQENPWLETEMIKIDDHPEAVNDYKILGLPTFVFLNKQGEEIKRFSGIVEKDVLIQAILENKDQ